MPLIATVDVPVSTTPPADETLYGALDFMLWREIGTSFLIKSTINNWIHCTTNGLLFSTASESAF